MPVRAKSRPKKQKETAPFPAPPRTYYYRTPGIFGRMGMPVPSCLPGSPRPLTGLPCPLSGRSVLRMRVHENGVLISNPRGHAQPGEPFTGRAGGTQRGNSMTGPQRPRLASNSVPLGQAQAVGDTFTAPPNRQAQAWPRLTADLGSQASPVSIAMQRPRLASNSLPLGQAQAVGDTLTAPPNRQGPQPGLAGGRCERCWNAGTRAPGPARRGPPPPDTRHAWLQPGVARTD